MSNGASPELIDVGPLSARSTDTAFIRVASKIDEACREVGFFSIVGHRADMAFLKELDSLSREFFALDDDEKAKISMDTGGPAWRGWFPAEGELTSGIPDRKEGIYFGTEIGPTDERVLAGTPLHGANLFPERPPGLRTAVLRWLDEMTAVGHTLLRGISVGLGLDDSYFAKRYTADPIVLFRIFKYAATPATVTEGFGVGEHTDYGLITLLAQDNAGGLQVKRTTGWVDVEPVEGALVCNLGDMLELMTGGRYRSTPHRVHSPVDVDRLSFPFFFDPAFDAQMAPIFEGADMAAISDERWDGASPLAFKGTYGDYLTAKVAKVFPDLFLAL